MRTFALVLLALAACGGAQHTTSAPTASASPALLSSAGEPTPAPTSTAPAPASGGADLSTAHLPDNDPPPETQQATCDKGGAEGPTACLHLGFRYETGTGVGKDLGHAKTLYEKACDSGEQGGCSNLGWLYFQGMGVAKDEAHAARLFQSACDARQPAACANIGEMYWRGNGVPHDGVRARALFKRACQLGDSKACAY
jgi:TPR repeat protein